MKKKITIEVALQRAKSLCSRQEKCIYDISEKLKAWGSHGKDIDKIVDALVQDGYIDEERFTKAYVNDKIEFNKWGKLKIKHALLQKKIAVSIVEKALDNFDEVRYHEIVNSEMMKKHKVLDSSDKFKAMQKLLRYGASRGYESDIVYSVIGSFFHE